MKSRISVHRRNAAFSLIGPSWRYSSRRTRKVSERKTLTSFFLYDKFYPFFLNACAYARLDHPSYEGSRLHGRPGQMPKTRRRAGDRTAGAGWQLCCLIDWAEELKFLSCLLRFAHTACKRINKSDKRTACTVLRSMRKRETLSKLDVSSHRRKRARGFFDSSSDL